MSDLRMIFADYLRIVHVDELYRPVAALFIVDIFRIFQYLSLDGNSLSTDDLLRLGKGHYLIKVRSEIKSTIHDWYQNIVYLWRYLLQFSNGELGFKKRILNFFGWLSCHSKWNGKLYQFSINQKKNVHCTSR